MKYHGKWPFRRIIGREIILVYWLWAIPRKLSEQLYILIRKSPGQSDPSIRQSMHSCLSWSMICSCSRDCLLSIRHSLLVYEMQQSNFPLNLGDCSGLQEALSFLFSLMNLAAHIGGLIKLRTSVQIINWDHGQVLHKHVPTEVHVRKSCGSRENCQIVLFLGPKEEISTMGVLYYFPHQCMGLELCVSCSWYKYYREVGLLFSRCLRACWSIRNPNKMLQPWVCPQTNQ